MKNTIYKLGHLVHRKMQALSSKSNAIFYRKYWVTLNHLTPKHRGVQNCGLQKHCESWEPIQKLPC